MTKTSSRIIVLVISLYTLYTILRYHVFKGVEWAHLPLFIMNKILAFSGFVLLVLSLALVISTLHFAIMGFEGWLTPGEWHGGMPSISMVSTFVFLVGILVYLLGQPKKS